MKFSKKNAPARIIAAVAVLTFTQAVAQAAAPTICGKSGLISLSQGRMRLMSNEYGSDANFCLALTKTGFQVIESSISNRTDGAPGAYPAVYMGCHWGTCTDKGPFPIQVSNLDQALSSWDTTQPESGAYNVSYDIWFNKSSTTTQPNGAELMIWLAKRGGIQPDGSPVGHFKAGSVDYTVWYSPNNKTRAWKYIAYVAEESQKSVTELDIAAFTGDAVKRKYIDPAWYMGGVEAGFEIWQGGLGLEANAFAFHASAKDPAK